MCSNPQFKLWPFKEAGIVMKKRKWKRRHIRAGALIPALALCLLLCMGLIIWYMETGSAASNSSERAANPEYWRGCPAIDAQLLTINPYSRPGIKMTSPKAVVIHWTANPGSSAQENRDYFEGLKDSKETKASAHFVIGLKGEVIQMIPCSEIAYANYPRNSDTISIECCTRDSSGKFSSATYDTVVKLAAWLCKAFQISPEQVIRHYDVSGKDCPKYYVDHPDDWKTLKADIMTQYETLTA
jgi:N-acetylmuramoyl-L-alanine amidase